MAGDAGHLVIQAQRLRNYLVQAGLVPQADLIDALFPFERDGATPGEEDRAQLYATFQAVKRRATGKVDDYTLNEVLSGRSPFDEEPQFRRGAVLALFGVLLVLFVVHFTWWSTKSGRLLHEAETFTEFDHFDQMSRLIEQALSYHRATDAVILGVSDGPVVEQQVLDYFERLQALRRHYVNEQSLLSVMPNHAQRMNPLSGTAERIRRTVCPSAFYTGPGEPPPLNVAQRFLLCAPPLGRAPPPADASAPGPVPDAASGTLVEATKLDPGDAAFLTATLNLLSGSVAESAEAPTNLDSVARVGFIAVALVERLSSQPAPGSPDAAPEVGDSLARAVVTRILEETSPNALPLDAFVESALVRLVQRDTMSAAGRVSPREYAEIVAVLQSYSDEIRHRLSLVSLILLPIIYGALGSLVYGMTRILNPAITALGFWHIVLRTAFAGLAALTLSMLILPSNLVSTGLDVTQPVVYLIAFVFGFAIESMVHLLNGLNRFFAGIMMPRVPEEAPVMPERRAPGGAAAGDARG